MEDVLDFMKEQDSLRTDENLKKLYDNVHYHHNAIEIWGRKWSRSYRESTKVWPQNPECIQDIKDEFKPRTFYNQQKDLQYFNYAAALEENEEMKRLGQKLPTEADFKAALQALPGEYEKECWYKGGNIFHLLFNGKNKHTGWLSSGGSLSDDTSLSYLWSSSEANAFSARVFGCDDAEGRLGRGHRSSAYPLRALVQ